MVKEGQFIIENAVSTVFKWEETRAPDTLLLEQSEFEGYDFVFFSMKNPSPILMQYMRRENEIDRIFGIYQGDKE